MRIKLTLDKYLTLADFFAPDYGRKNEVLINFKELNPILSAQHTADLIELLKNSNEITHNYFVADLLYLFPQFDSELLEPLLQAGINCNDPSYNRIFLRPCISTFGIKTVANKLIDKFMKADVVDRIGIANLIYWLRPQENENLDRLHETFINEMNKSTNLVELYHYKLRYSNKIKGADKIPNSASELIQVIKGNKEYEDLLFNKCGWVNP